MPTGKATKASDKAQVFRKFVTAAQKLYGKSVPKLDLPVLETFLFAVCLEDNSWEAAEQGYKKMLASYFDLNEIRVSSVTELEQTLAPLRDADWKGLRIRSILRYVFESSYSFDWEKFRRLTQEVALKSLKKVNDLSPFVRDFTLQHLLGSHLVCIDASMLRTAKWLGLVPPDLDQTAAGEYLKAGLKKSEVAEFCHVLRSLATDPKFYDRFFEPLPPEVDLGSVTDRLAEVQQPPRRKPPKPPEKPAKAPETSAKSAPKKVAPKAAPPAKAPPAPARKDPSKPVRITAKAPPAKAGKPAPPIEKKPSGKTAKPAAAQKPGNKKPATKKPGKGR